MNAHGRGKHVQRIVITEQRRGLGRGGSLRYEEFAREQTDEDEGSCAIMRILEVDGYYCWREL